ncbi:MULTISPECIES: anhydro-N-acetylmuramic acid kinase [Bartonella]|uniref:anhydro-N-acetylmuramic acid kinase n=1 Tax=Bartonella TaxID=773 RepID=UPI0018DB9A84|nr:MULTISPECIES: anhydro-N-acetylmuramic acid kinase [Bartonella]MBH9994463.1 anhydro-N-acetylmuramic acid kinase [Bartonella sp. P0291]MBH9997192.1 anhydro-N-acetylmuramic acid kinase [Bartonella sp. M0192]MBH9999352.1 anhydro-N-acetylmuramic acid kinase [Bartonella sp. M0191]MBI0007166.1 anhydro-N-acetylmuramic acid kinase [Bartonella sp. M0193]MBI0010643.1 anhydro-N-acetylmuramic acid kinase [Bartonella sp. M0176]
MRTLKTAIGLMSGTSMDGIDAALIESDGEKIVNIIGHSSCEYDVAFHKKLKSTLDEVTNVVKADELSRSVLNVGDELTIKHAFAVNQLLKKYSISPNKVDLIGFHGQTILHKPDIGLTIQIGNGAMLAQQCGIDVVFDLRSNDMKHGGQGAPLVPVYHRALALKLSDKLDFPVAFINIGGISNLTFVGKNDELYAFDCGPGNGLIDQWMYLKTGSPMDRNGEAGLRGTVKEEIVNSYSRHPFFSQRKPGSLDWRSFKPLTDKAVSVEDGAASLSFVTAYGIVNSFRHLPTYPKTLVLSGGGAYNRAIIKALEELTQKYGIITLTAQSLGLSSDFIEAEAWAYLAIRSIYNLPITFPTTTGCLSPQSGGRLARHQNKTPDRNISGN